MNKTFLKTVMISTKVDRTFTSRISARPDIGFTSRVCYNLRYGLQKRSVDFKAVFLYLKIQFV